MLTIKTQVILSSFPEMEGTVLTYSMYVYTLCIHTCTYKVYL